MNPSELAQIIRSTRQQLRLTQHDLACRAEMSRRTLHAIESGLGTNDIGLQKLQRLLQVLGLRLAITSEIAPAGLAPPGREPATGAKATPKV